MLATATHFLPLSEKESALHSLSLEGEGWGEGEISYILSPSPKPSPPKGARAFRPVLKYNATIETDVMNKTKRARNLRSKQTDAERALWHLLRNRQLSDLKFRRQHPIGSYVVDFVYLSKKLIIEVDGGQHSEQKQYDKQRTNFLNSQGYMVLRYWNNDVLTNPQSVMESIHQTLEQIDEDTIPHPQL